MGSDPALRLDDMKPESPALTAPYDGSALIADPIHEYITFTVPYTAPDQTEQTEKDLIDSSWVQPQV